MPVEPSLGIPPSTCLYLARHATPDRTRLDIPYHTPPGPNLTETGVREAAELGAYFLSVGVRHILASPLERAWRTAHIAAAIAGAVVEQNEDIAEWRLDEVEKGVSERMQRAYALACRLSAAHGPVAFVSHGAPVLTLLKDLGLGQAELDRHRIYDSRNPLPPAGAWQVAPDGLRLSFVPVGVRWPMTALI